MLPERRRVAGMARFVAAPPDQAVRAGVLRQSELDLSVLGGEQSRAIVIPVLVLLAFVC